MRWCRFFYFQYSRNQSAKNWWAFFVLLNFVVTVFDLPSRFYDEVGVDSFTGRDKKNRPWQANPARQPVPVTFRDRYFFSLVW